MKTLNLTPEQIGILDAYDFAMFTLCSDSYEEIYNSPAHIKVNGGIVEPSLLDAKLHLIEELLKHRNISHTVKALNLLRTNQLKAYLNE